MTTTEPPISIVDGVYGTFFFPPGDLMERQTIRYGSHTRPEIALLLDVVRPGDIVLDVGAHVGTVAVPLARRTGPTGQLLAFEPDPASLIYLEANLALNLVANWSHIHPVAVGHEPGWVDIFIQDDANTGANFAVPSGKTESAVRVVALDDVVGATVDVIKIDVEGMECDVLRGATRLIEDGRPVIHLEVSGAHLERAGTTTSELETILVAGGYRFFRNVGDRNASDGQYDLQPIVTLPIDELTDVLCVHESSDRLPT